MTGKSCTLSKFIGYTKLGGAPDTQDGHAAIQQDPNRLKKWTETKLSNFKKGAV